MRRYEICAVNTMFKKKRKSPATYLSVVSKGTTPDAGQFVGLEIKERWKKRDYIGKILEVKRKGGTKKWTVKFDDGYVAEYTESAIEAKLVSKKPIMWGHQLDYIMVSQRWKSSVQDSSVRWGPSEHRNLRGRADHALVQCNWSWKLRTVKKKVAKDFSVLSKAAPTQNLQILQQFDEAITAKAKELSEDTESTPSLDKQYEQM